MALGSPTRVVRVRRPPARPGWTAVVVAAAAVAVVPVAVIAVSGLTPTVGIWRELWAGELPSMIATTVLLLLAVGAGTLVLGAGLAWLVTAYRFPGRGVLSWLLVLPFAMPAYVLGFVALSVLDYPGPVQTALRSVFGPDVWFPEIRSVPAAAAVLTLSLYPYVYLLARAAFTQQAPAAFDAARTLGAGRGTAARRVVLPLARPALAAGLVLVMMETLTDFGTVLYFNVDTVTVGVYRVWKGQFDRDAATELAALVLLFALVVLLAERLLRGRSRYHQRPGGGQGLPPVVLRGGRAWVATGTCVAVLAVAFVLPVAQLALWSLGRAAEADAARFAEYLGNSVGLAAFAAVGCAVVAVVLSSGVRFSGGRSTAFAAQLTTAGYAVPGVVVAIGVLVAFGGLDDVAEAVGVPGGTGLLATGTVIGVGYAYLVRFLALAYQSVDASMATLTPSVTASALVLGARPRRVLTRVHLPLLRGGIGVALLLVAVDALKELPIVLLLRPIGFTTVSVWVWQLASESRWEAAALPALLIVAVATVPVVLLFRTRSSVGGRP